MTSPAKGLKPPAHLSAESRATWKRIAAEYELTPDASLLLRAGLECWDLAVNYYQNPLCLMLRDGGVLFGHAALVAAALGLSFRILGSTGTPFTERLVSNISFKPTAVGLAWIGRAHAD